MSWDQNLTQRFFFLAPFYFLSFFNQDMCVLQVQGLTPFRVHFVGSQRVKCDLPPPPAEVSWL